MRFSADGRVFVAEKSGLIKVFDGLDDTSPTVFADLRTKVHNFWDRGLLGMALAPNFPTDPFVYVLYTYDAAIGGTAPRWGTAGATSDGCPTPPGPTTDGCVVSGRLSRLAADGDTAVGPEQVLVEDWCQQFPSHSIGALAFGPDGSLYASGGDGASFTFADYGQTGTPKNPCGDPPGAPGDHPDAADRRRRRAAQPGRPHDGRPGRPQRVGHPHRSRPRARACPATRGRPAPTPTSGASSATGCATRSGSPRGRGPTRSGSGTSAGTTSRRSTA